MQLMEVSHYKLRRLRKPSQVKFQDAEKFTTKNEGKNNKFWKSSFICVHITSNPSTNIKKLIRKSPKKKSVKKAKISQQLQKRNDTKSVLRDWIEITNKICN